MSTGLLNRHFPVAHRDPSLNVLYCSAASGDAPPLQLIGLKVKSASSHPLRCRDPAILGKEYYPSLNSEYFLPLCLSGLTFSFCPFFNFKRPAVSSGFAVLTGSSYQLNFPLLLSPRFSQVNIPHLFPHTKSTSPLNCARNIVK